MKDDKYNINWIVTEEPISVKLTFGEIRIARFAFQGIRWMPDIFLTPPVSHLHPPVDTMKTKGVQLARVHSCPIRENIRRISIKERTLCYIDEIYNYYYTDIGGDFQEYIKSRKKVFKDIRRKIKKIESINNGEASFEIYSLPHEIEDFFKQALPISKKTYQHLLLDEGLPENQKYIDESIEKSKKGA
ncbi:MAG: hypothetical protein D3908_12495, partial [Candidatus Electrothrix sp. AUS4]|nr:hypothetical protein [Candidatus Electrothrix sp. AUS4]